MQGRFKSIRDKENEARQRVRQHRAAVALALMAAVVAIGAIVVFAAMNSGTARSTGSYKMMTLTAGSYSSTVECDGEVEPIKVADVTTNASGTVTAVRVKDGDYVRKGDVLFEMRSDGQEASPVAASVAGIVTDLRVKEGMGSDELSNDTPAMRIADMNVLVGVVKVPEYISVLLKNGQYASMTSPATPNVSYQGMLMSLTTSSSGLNEEGQTPYDAKIMFDDIGSLKVGDPITASFDIDDYGEVFYVPSEAVKEDDGMAYVCILRPHNTIEQHQVELLGTSDSGEKIIKSDDLTNETVIRADLDE